MAPFLTGPLTKLGRVDVAVFAVLPDDASFDVVLDEGVRVFHDGAILPQVNLSGDQITIHQPLADAGGDDRGHLIGGVGFADIVPPRKLRDVPIQMLRAHVMVGAVIAPLEHRPEGFHPVRVGLAAHILVG